MSSLLKGNEHSPEATPHFLLSVVLSLNTSFESPSPLVWAVLLIIKPYPVGGHYVSC